MLTLIQRGQVQANQTTGIEPLAKEQLDNKRNPRRQLFEVGHEVPKTLYQQVARLVSNFLQHIRGREPESAQPERMATKKPRFFLQSPPLNEAREVRGIADRITRPDPQDSTSSDRDLILLGEANDYPDAVIAIQYNNMTKPVLYEGKQVVARGLYLDSSQNWIDGELILADGSRLPVHIRVLTAV